MTDHLRAMGVAIYLCGLIAIMALSWGRVQRHWHDMDVQEWSSFWGTRAVRPAALVMRLERDGHLCDIVGSRRGLGLRTANCDSPGMDRKVVRWWNSAAVSTLYDQVGFADMSQPVTAERPVFLQNGEMRMLRFDGQHGVYGEFMEMRFRDGSRN